MCVGKRLRYHASVCVMPNKPFGVGARLEQPACLLRKAAEGFYLPFLICSINTVSICVYLASAAEKIR